MGLPNIGPLELIIILAIALLIVGPGKLPELGSAFGRTIREFRKASSDISDATRVEPKPSTAAPQPSTAAPQPSTAAPQPSTLSQSVATQETNTPTADVATTPVESAPRGTPADPVEDPA